MFRLFRIEASAERMAKILVKADRFAFKPFRRGYHFRERAYPQTSPSLRNSFAASNLSWSVQVEMVSSSGSMRLRSAARNRDTSWVVKNCDRNQFSGSATGFLCNSTIRSTDAKIVESISFKSLYSNPSQSQNRSVLGHKLINSVVASHSA